MSSPWCATVAMLCPAAARPAAAIVAAHFTGNPADTSPSFFLRPVGLVGAPDVLFYVAHSRIRAHVLEALPALEVQFPGAQWAITQHDGDGPDSARPSLTSWLAWMGLEFKDQSEALDVDTSDLPSV